MSEGATVREVGRGAIYIALGKVVFLLTATAINLLLPRLLSARAYGDYGVVVRLVSLFNMMTVMGLLQSVSRLVAAQPAAAAATRRRASLLAAIAAAGIAVPFAASSPLMARALRDAGLSAALALAALITFGYGVYAAAIGVVNGLQRFRTQALLDMGFSAAKCAGVLGAALGLVALAPAASDRDGTVAAVLGFAAAAALLALVAQLVARRASRDAGAPLAAGWSALARRMLSFAGAVMLYQATLNALMSVDLLLVKRHASGALADAAGLYNAAVNVAQIPYFGVVAITFVAFPLISASTFGDDVAATRRYVHAAFRYGALIAIGCAAVIAGCAGDLLALLFPARYGAAGAALAVLVVDYALLALIAIGCTVINAVGRPLLSFAAVALATALAGALVAGAIDRWGLMGAAAGTTGGTVCGLALTLWWLRRAVGAGPALLSTLRIAAAGIIAAGVGIAVPPLGAAWVLFELAGLGLLYLALLIVGRELGPADLDALRALLGRRRS
ncbi:MAG: oligosaccharide flippase family protein [Deltaproteobacteria bacterium]|nr:oligosaccharide flippase family protein [Deltaproteobacteria bacterium]